MIFMKIKPLFIPLKTQWFRAFESGEKTVEYRAYGPRWNERTCTPGRAATLSHGYSGDRIHAEVVYIQVLPAHMTPKAAREFFPLASHIVAIHLAL
jgi:hypothetical protein